jgi:hypothetical protein
MAVDLQGCGGSPVSVDPVARFGGVFRSISRTVIVVVGLERGGQEAEVSMCPCPVPAVPESTARVARMAFRKGCLAMRLLDEVSVLFEDEQFVEAFPSRGGPGLSPGMLALVSVLQYAENLTDRQAAEQVKGRIDWKYALSLELEDPGFTSPCCAVSGPAWSSTVWRRGSSTSSCNARGNWTCCGQEGVSARTLPMSWPPFGP